MGGRECGPGGRPCCTYSIVHAVVMWLVLGEENARSIGRVGELGSMDEVIHWGTSSSYSTSRGVSMREVEVSLAVVAVALKGNRINKCQEAKFI